MHKGVGMSVLLGALVLAVSVAGCSSSGDSNTESQLGKVSMQLTGQTNGNTYRLRNARFDVTGPTNTVLDSEADLTLATLNATLSTGAYSINLEPGWSLERNDAGTFNVVDAMLTSMNPRAFQILGGSTTNIAYQFSTNGTLVTIGTGDLSVSIDVTENGGTGMGTCSIAPQGGCAAPQGCYFVSDSTGMSGAGQCFPPGTVLIGGTCTGAATNECVVGGVCASDGTTAQCFQMCNLAGTNTCAGGQTCQATGVANLNVCL
jgi:hypothetical protein